MPNSQSYQIKMLVLYKGRRNYTRVHIMEETQEEAKKQFDMVINKPTVREYEVLSEGFITLRPLTEEEKEYSLTHTVKRGDYFVPSLYRKTHRS